MSKTITNEIGMPITKLQTKALEEFNEGNWDDCKMTCLCDPCDPYLACLSCLSSAFRSPMIADSVLRDAARHSIECVKSRAQYRLSQSFTEILRDN
jgi:hypothetical protein